eukprot:9818851-Heterocapsa_arctica.AAC.1
MAPLRASPLCHGASTRNPSGCTHSRRWERADRVAARSLPRTRISLSLSLPSSALCRRLPLAGARPLAPLSLSPPASLSPSSPSPPSSPLAWALSARGAT